MKVWFYCYLNINSSYYKRMTSQFLNWGSQTLFVVINIYQYVRLTLSLGNNFFFSSVITKEKKLCLQSYRVSSIIRTASLFIWRKKKQNRLFKNYIKLYQSYFLLTWMKLTLTKDSVNNQKYWRCRRWCFCRIAEEIGITNTTDSKQKYNKPKHTCNKYKIRVITNICFHETN